MSDGKVHELRIPTDDGNLVTVRVRVKGRCDQDGVEGVLLALLHPNNTDFEIIEYWAPIASNPELDALLHDRRPE
jgi:hypothetical protein